MAVTYQENWNLDALFPGGSRSAAFFDWLDTLHTDATVLAGKLNGLSAEDASVWVDTYLDLQQVSGRFSQASSYVACLTAADMGDAQANQLEKRVDALAAQMAGLNVQFDAGFAALPRAVQADSLSNPRLVEIRFSLEERLERVQMLLDPARETLIADLQVDGYQGWERMYYALLNTMAVPVVLDGRETSLSMGQAANRLAHPDRIVRNTVFTAWTETWRQHASLFAETLNHVAGFRLQTYRHRHWDNVLSEPVRENRIRPETLSTMWATVNLNKAPLVAYLKRKAQLLDLPALAWFDVAAPLPGGQQDIPFAQAAQFVVDQFSRFSPDMGAYAERALEQGWVEAENRAGKRTGAFCTRFPVSQESRVFMTYAGTVDNISTLAHELGHAYHGWLLRELPYYATRYPMGLAESASTFAEIIVVDAALREATDGQAKIALLDQKIQNTVTFFMDIHCRYLFETRLYERRAQGALTTDELCTLMEAAQQDAFCSSLGSYHPYFWATKLHFYDTSTPFYNFPYTLGYLFSSGLYARALADGPGFAKRYVDILRDTGRMSMEEVARVHLGVDLTEPEFWQSAIDVLLEDVHEFLRLTDSTALV